MISRLSQCLHFTLLVYVAALISACGTDPTPVESSSSESSSSSAPVYAGQDQTVLNSQLVELSVEGTADWEQVSGPSVVWVAQDANPAVFIAPDVSAATELVFEAQAGAASDRVTVTVEPCNAADDMVFDDCIAPGFGAWVSYESSEAKGTFFHVDGNGDYHVQWQMLDSGDVEHGEVMEITWNANDEQHQNNDRGWFGLAMPGAAATEGSDLSEYSEGALSFDMRLVYHEQPSNAAGFITKMECVYPCVSGEMSIANGHTSYEWQTHTYPISQLTSTGLDLTQVNHVFVIQPDWFAQEQTVSIQIDNIKLSKTYERPEPQEGCTGAGNVSYTLGRASNPTADQQEAYGLITAAMDVAVENYNCYTNLTRHLTVEYNPGVQTADGSTNGNIRFGSRASMHYVTAMHEIAHTFGAGGSNTFHALVSDGIFHGANATAKLREISGDPSAQLKSDGTHFWPHGLNYISEGGTQQDLIHHCWIVEAIYRDLSGF